MLVKRICFYKRRIKIIDRIVISLAVIRVGRYIQVHGKCAASFLKTMPELQVGAIDIVPAVHT